MARMRTYVCVAVGLLVLSIVMIGLAEERNDQGNPNSSGLFQTKQVFTGTFTIPIDGATFTKLASLDVSAYSSIRLERTVLDAPSLSLEVHVSVNRGGCP